MKRVWINPQWLLRYALVALCWSSSVHGQSYPTKPVRLVVPWPPGATADTVARAVMQKVGERFGHQVVVDNRGGASTIIGTAIVAKSPSDGYTLLLAPFNFGANPGLFAKLPYDSAKDFAAVSLLGVSPIVLVVNPLVPVKSVRELIGFATGSPGKLNYASAGNGSSNHLAGELFNFLTGTRLTHVPYGGGAPAATAVVAGEVQLLFAATSSAISQLRAGRLRALAVASPNRSRALLDIPTMSEGGAPGCEVAAWHGVVVPAETPNAVITLLNLEIARALQLKDVAQRLASLGFDPVGGTPVAFDRFIKTEMTKWAKVVDAAKLTLN